MKRCPTCNSIVPRGHGYKTSQIYCSYECYKAKTPKMIEVEKEWGTTIKELLKMYSNKTALADLLGITRQTLTRWENAKII